MSRSTDYFIIAVLAGLVIAGLLMVKC